MPSILAIEFPFATYWFEFFLVILKLPFAIGWLCFTAFSPCQLSLALFCWIFWHFTGGNMESLARLWQLNVEIFSKVMDNGYGGLFYRVRRKHNVGWVSNLPFIPKTLGWGATAHRKKIKQFWLEIHDLGPISKLSTFPKNHSDKCIWYIRANKLKIICDDFDLKIPKKRPKYALILIPKYLDVLVFVSIAFEKIWSQTSFLLLFFPLSNGSWPL